ncbi:DDE-type integrase/transposase/recombinase [Congregibacter sp.]
MKSFVRINGKQHCLWRAVDPDGEVVDVYLQAKRDGDAKVQISRSGSTIPGRTCCS